MNKEKNKLKKIILYFTIVIFGLYLLYYLFFYGFSYPPCAEREIQTEVPDFLKDSEIIFEHQMAYVIKPKEGPENIKGRDCTDLNKISKGFIISIDSNAPKMVDSFRNYGYTVNFIPEKTKFKVIKRAYIKCRTFLCIDTGDVGDTFLLQDDNRDLWRINYLYFENLDRSARIKPYNAGYYKEGVRLNDVKIDELIP